MRASASASYPDHRDKSGISGFMRRQLEIAAGLAIIVLLIGAAGSLATWNVADPSFSHATDGTATNALGYPGSVFADLSMQFYGLAALPALLPAVFWALFMIGGKPIYKRARRGFAWFFGALFTAAAFGCATPPQTWPLPVGVGGVLGDLVLKMPAVVIGGFPKGMLSLVLALPLLAAGIWLLAFGAALVSRKAPAPVKEIRSAAGELLDDDEEEGGGFQAIAGAVTHYWLSMRASLARLTASRRAARDERDALQPASKSGRARHDRDDDITMAPAPKARLRQEPDFSFAPQSARSAHEEPSFEDDDSSFLADDEEEAPFEMDGDFAPDAIAPRTAARVTLAHERRLSEGGEGQPVARVQQPAPRPKGSQRAAKEAQPSFLQDGGYVLPGLHFLSETKNIVRDPTLSKDALEQNARLLEGVLDDFGVKGEIIQVKPGPVVTLYELEPAPGIKSSRVIGLADDIARSMSAIAARVAVVPGRNAIGIELPNQRRETVYLREMMACQDFGDSKGKLALALGKNINGEPVIADLAKMPHLLVAGTTGSGKSVAINTMILSLVYRMTPKECRLIMIDPKMLELSVYDGIPHLLTPVVTDPKKAVVALKWTVREMEDRYRKMSKVGVRNIDGFNQRIALAKQNGEKLSRTLQTGFDRATGEAVYETEILDLEPMPFIVVIIDEMADLMMVAGKDIEGAVQRLAQMARAAGIHVIMATQRPSVDVITGTIKANFPTRISFQVTSKIDSRTILGEQGGEQLLGQGDMLYMAGGGRIQRVHGPFVSDDEVEKIVAHLKTQGVPEYLDSITEEDDEDGDEGGSAGGSAEGDFEDSDDPYDQAVAVVLRDKKASTSYIQRRLGIGYNRAASLIERMEKEGIVGPSNHAGKREILVPVEEDY
jgi:DNA segregation ATPase FtsK/SpoIIIE, S-DNA-T family